MISYIPFTWSKKYLDCDLEYNLDSDSHPVNSMLLLVNIKIMITINSAKCVI